MANDLKKLSDLVRYYILESTTAAGSGHPTSSLSAVELMVALLFGGRFRADLDNPDYPNNDRFILSKGHASPLFYALYAAAGRIDEDELRTLRRFGSRLEGHPTLAFPYTEAATGSLGQGLSIGVGMAMTAKYLDKLPYNTFVLLGDGGMAEGSQWEAIQLAAHYRLDNLIGIIDVNRLGQSEATMYGHDVGAIVRRVSGFDWAVLEVDGHSLDEVTAAYDQALAADRPAMIVAKTLKGKGFSIFEDAEGWHGKPLSREQMDGVIGELGEVDKSIVGELAEPGDGRPLLPEKVAPPGFDYQLGEKTATRVAYGKALVRIAPAHPEMVVLDAEVNNSTYTKYFKEAYPDRFFQMYIAEQNMVGTALGMSRRGRLPFISTFATFFSRAYDQIRMSQYSRANIKFAGSHVGVSIGEDGASQMGLADIALFRSIFNGIVVYPADAVATERLVEGLADRQEIAYIRLTRMATPVLYGNDEEFPIGGSKVLRESTDDRLTLVAAGVTLYEALAAHDELKEIGIMTRVIDLYSVKPIDWRTLGRAAVDTGMIVTVEDHFPAGGIGEAVISALAAEHPVTVHTLAVRKTPRSGSPAELLDYEEISRAAIVKKVLELRGHPGTPT